MNNNVTNNKLNLSGDITLKNVILDKNIYNIPKRISVDFSQIRPIYKYVDGKRSDKLNGYAMTGISEDAYKAATVAGLEMADIKPIHIEVEGNSSVIEEYIGSMDRLVVELQDTRVQLRYVPSFNGGAYSGVKLIAKGLKLFDNKA